MALPVTANATCDIYRNLNSPPAAPDVAAVPCHLRPDWPRAMEMGDRNSLSVSLAWTHVMLVDLSVDIRDAYQGALNHSDQDTVYIPDQDGTPFKVTFIERVFRGQAHDHKRIYLDRQAPTWPTNDL